MYVTPFNSFDQNTNFGTSSLESSWVLSSTCGSEARLAPLAEDNSIISADELARSILESWIQVGDENSSITLEGNNESSILAEEELANFVVISEEDPEIENTIAEFHQVDGKAIEREIEAEIDLFHVVDGDQLDREEADSIRSMEQSWVHVDAEEIERSAKRLEDEALYSSFVHVAEEGRVRKVSRWLFDKGIAAVDFLSARHEKTNSIWTQVKSAFREANEDVLRSDYGILSDNEFMTRGEQLEAELNDQYAPLRRRLQSIGSTAARSAGPIAAAALAHSLGLGLFGMIAAAGHVVDFGSYQGSVDDAAFAIGMEGVLSAPGHWIRANPGRAVRGGLSLMWSGVKCATRRFTPGPVQRATQDYITYPRKVIFGGLSTLWRSFSAYRQQKSLENDDWVFMDGQGLESTFEDNRSLFQRARDYTNETLYATQQAVQQTGSRAFSIGSAAVGAVGIGTIARFGGLRWAAAAHGAYRNPDNLRVYSQRRVARVTEFVTRPLNWVTGFVPFGNRLRQEAAYQGAGHLLNRATGWFRRG